MLRFIRDQVGHHSQRTMPPTSGGGGTGAGSGANGGGDSGNSGESGTGGPNATTSSTHAHPHRHPGTAHPTPLTPHTVVVLPPAPVNGQGLAPGQGLAQGQGLGQGQGLALRAGLVSALVVDSDDAAGMSLGAGRRVVCLPFFIFFSFCLFYPLT